MQKHLPIYAIFVVLICSILIVVTESKGFGGSRGGGGFKGSAKGPGSFGGSASYNRPSGYGMNMAKPSGSSFKKNAMSFAAGAAGGVAAYSLMRAMSGGYRSGYYAPGYGVGETCFNNENLNGTVFGSFRCPLNGFPMEARYCCGERGHQFCCIREERHRFSQGASHVIWITLVLIVLLVIAIFWARRRRQQQKDVIMVPTDVPPNEPPAAPYYHPAPPPMGYPPPPQGNPYAPPPQSYPNNYNPYQPQPGPTPYPAQQPPYYPYQTGQGY